MVDDRHFAAEEAGQQQLDGVHPHRLGGESLLLQQLQRAMQVMPLTHTAAQHYGQIRAALERAGQPIGNNDLWVAAHARAEGWVLITNNEREFCRVDGLVVENGATPA